MTTEHPRDLGAGPDPERVDLDLLADYAGGALDGTPAYDRMARLVDTRPQWAAALDALRAADTLVRADLAALDRQPEPLPPGLADRLQAAFDAEPSPSRAEATPDAAPPGPHESETAPREAEVVPLARRRLRRYRIAAAGAVAAGLIALAGSVGYVGLQGAGDMGDAKTTAERDGDAASAPDAATEGRNDHAEGLAQGRYPAPVLASGRDYRRDSLASAATLRGESERAKAAMAAPADLSRLTDPAALRACLTAIQQTYAGTPRLVDYARFEGSPALIVVLADGDTRRVVVAGSECGVDDADVTHHTTA